MGQKFGTLRQQQSQAELLYEMVSTGNVEAIKDLHREGASLEWTDEEGKTPLILACMEPKHLPVARILIELGANVNAYRPGSHGGTPLHHAAKRGLTQTVQLLLSQRANVLVRNDDGHTSLDVARLERNTGIVRAIENHISYFSGWLREFYGPRFLEALTPQLPSRKVWVVVIPYGSCSQKEPSRLELVIYPTCQDSRPHTGIDLLKSKVEEPAFDQWDPKVTIFHESTSSKYRFASAEEGDIQQLQCLYSACRGIPQATPPAVLPDTQTSSSSIDTSQTAAETMNTNSWGISDDSSSLKGWGPSLQTEAINTNGWGNPDDSSTFVSWGLSRQCKHSEINSNGWMEKPTKENYNGWGVLDSKRDASSDAISTKGWGSSNDSSSHNGWCQPLGRGHSEVNSSGWLEKPAKDDYNGWGVLDSEPVNQLNQHVQNHDNNSHVVSENSFSSGSDPTLPSAPPIPDDGMSNGQILYPSIDFSKPMAEASVVNGFKNGSRGDRGGGESSCVICWEAPIEGACVPCGHMAGCISCLNDVKAKKGVCPICRTKLEQVMKLYVV